MVKKLRGRNLAHPGCLIGVTIGLIVGIVIAAILATMNAALNTVLLVWLGLTLGLGAIGWIIGDRLSSRFPAVHDQASLNEPTTKSTVDVPKPLTKTDDDAILEDSRTYIRYLPTSRQAKRLGSECEQEDGTSDTHDQATP
jgi:hypothetical protein